MEVKLQQVKLYYLKIESEKKWTIIPKIKKNLEIGDSSLAIIRIKKNLKKMGDYASLDSNTAFNEDLKLAIINFQKRMGMEQNGIINNALISRINTSIDYILKQIEASIKTISELAIIGESDFIYVNIPAFHLQVFKNNIPQIDMKVIVGKYKNKTPTFNTKLSAVVVCPYWNVPKSIQQKEILPLLKKNPNYLKKHDMEWSYGKIRQRPGPTNSLGRIKFLIPNRYSVFLHDTPVKSLFEKRVRMFSHGCIRLNDARKLALYLMQQDNTWDSAKLENAILENLEKRIEVKTPIPVYVSYLTAWVDEKGILQMRDDIYGKNK
jgi:murein L,D-transpeptidase YcbB/YkuD